MSERKNIDKLFQEKFKDFEVKPSEKVWKNIKIELEEKDKNRTLIPFWWKLSGIAAALIIGGFILKNNFTTQKSTIKNVVVQSENNSDKNKIGTESTTKSSIGKSSNINNNNTVVKSEKTLNQNDKNSNFLNKNIVKEENLNKIQKIKFAQSTYLKQIAKQKSSQNKFFRNKNNQNQQNQIANNDLENGVGKETSLKENTISDEKSNPIANNTILKNEENSILETQKDSTKKVIVATNELQKIFDEKDKKILKTIKENKWQITTNVAPIYLGSTANGSPLDQKFDKNVKEYKTSLSYGLGVNYNINKRFIVKSGINKLSLDYNTNDIIFFADIQNSKMQNVTPTQNNAKVRVENKSQMIVPEDNTNNSVNNGYINQKLGYIEIPLEMSYKIIDKKFGISINGGLSTLLLNENKISVVSPDYNLYFGEANNLNKMHFSTNIGLGFKYKLYKSLHVNLDPTFKYQIKTFTNNTGNFKPYYFGIYSGFSYNF